MPHINSNISITAKLGIINSQFYRGLRLCSSNDFFVSQMGYCGLECYQEYLQVPVNFVMLCEEHCPVHKKTANAWWINSLGFPSAARCTLSHSKHALIILFLDQVICVKEFGIL
jgi:hypothetical protein